MMSTLVCLQRMSGTGYSVDELELNGARWSRKRPQPRCPPAAPASTAPATGWRQRLFPFVFSHMPMSSPPSGVKTRPIRIVASGTIFFTHALTLPSFPDEGTVSRARTVVRTRGGSAANVLATLGQFADVKAMLIAPLAGSSEGTVLVRDLQREGVDTRYCRVWEGANVPSAWIIEAGP